ncbi:ovostatin-like [Watersipora subatra]|uniref:ovostatin-like n=1 Tax=Watersipora subatra TaxID=2589382 RepID=UPI00355BD16B
MEACKGYMALMILSILSSMALAKRGYVMTAPSQFIPNRPETVCIDLVEVTTNTSVELSIFKSARISSSQSISTSQANIVDRMTFTMSPAESSKCVVLTLPENVKTKYLVLTVRGDQLPLQPFGWSFYGQNLVRVLDQYTPTEICIIQTDKPEYKPSQTVQISVLRLDTRLRPINQPMSNVAIRTPSGVTVEQWLNVPVKSGMAALKFELADELEKGDWSIVVTEHGKEKVKTFSVKQYELPGFDVTITPPASAMLRDESVTAVVCATYTYGQFVSGVLSGSICLVQPFMRVSEGAFCHNITELKINGCLNITADRVSTGWDYRYNDWANSELVFQVSVTDDDAGETVSAPQASVPFTNSPYILNLQGADNFRPGLPYHFKVMVSRTDGEPGHAQLVTITVSKNSTGQTADYRKGYTTDSNGVAYVTIPPFIGHFLDIQASLEGTFGYPTLTASLAPTAWYSSSGSHLQIVPLKDSNSIICGSSLKYRVQYSTSTSGPVTVYYKLVGSGDIAASFKQSVTLTTLTLLSAKDPLVSWDSTSSWQTTPIQANLAVRSKPVDPAQPVFNPGVSIKTATHKGSFTVNFRVTSDLSPRSHLLVYYARADGEVVADSIAFDVPECSANKVGLSLSRDIVSPGQSVQLLLTASPGSTCGYNMMDRNTFTHSTESYPTLASVIKRMERYLLPSTSLPTYLPLNFYCGNLHGVPAEYPGFASYWEKPSLYRHRDAHQGFVRSGLVVSSTLHMRSAPCKRIYYRTHDAMNPAVQPVAAAAGVSPPAFAALSGQLSQPTQSSAIPAIGATSEQTLTPEVAVVVPPSVPNRDSTRTELEQTLKAGPRPQMLQFVKDVTSYFPETMLFDIVDINPAGNASVQVTVPDSTTQWIGSAVCSDNEDGLGISTPITLTAFHPYVVSVSLPSMTALRGEIIPVEVTITNYLGACLAVNVALQPSTSYMIIGELMLATEPSLCICAGGSATRTYNIFLQEIGEKIPITVTANTVGNRLACPIGSIMSNRIGLSESVVKHLHVLPQGIPRAYTYGDYICVNSASNITFEKEYRLPRPNSRSRVSHSTTGMLTVVGDLMGPAIEQPDMLISPAVGGEANVARFAPSVHLLKYLDATGQRLPAAAREEALQNIKSGYQRQLSFVHPDGSYSWFGPNQSYELPEDVPSLWLTSYVLKSLAQAKPLVHIDEPQLQTSLQYILSKQDPWGCFPQVGRLHNRAMQLAVDPALGDNFALTAYVTVALIEAGYGDVATESLPEPEGVVHKALECMFVRSRRFRAIRDGYTMTLVAYAFALHNTTDTRSKRAFAYMRRMQSTASDGHKSWRALREGSRIKTGNHWFNRPLAVDVETTSYGLLTTMLMANRTAVLDNGFAIVQWLSDERRARGGFSTSQDTVIALQALSEYATKFAPRQTNVNITAHFSDTVNGTRVLTEQVASFAVTTSTSLDVSKVELPRIRSLVVTATGTGCVRFQTSLNYNIVRPDRSGQPFTTDVTVRNNTRLSQLCKRKPLLICTSYVGEGESSLVVMEVKMQSGWAVEESLVEQLLEYQSLRVKRYDVSPYDNSLTLYFSSLQSRRICFFLYLKRTASVRSGQPAVVTTYDYYRRDSRQETTYQITCSSS